MPQNVIDRGENWLPDFVRRRMDDFYIGRMRDEWGGKHIMHSATPGPGAVQLVSNDYLSLNNHPEIVAAQVNALQMAGREMVMSGVFQHGDNPSSRFEKRMAELVGMEAGILSQSGYAANVGLIQSLTEGDRPVYIDMNAHASLWEGITSAGAKARTFRHNDPEHLRRLLRENGPGVICVDSVYSTTGSVAPLADIVRVSRESGSVLIVDESHSLGSHGPEGGGLVHELGLTDQVQFITASLAKAFAGRAGIICCSEEFREYFRCTARPAIFSSALLDHEVAALDKTLDLVIRDRWRRERLHENAAWLRRELDRLGYNVSASQSQIIALEAGLERDTLQLREALEARGVFGSVFCAPATPKKRSLIRLSVNASLTIQELQKVVDVCAEIRDEVGMWDWPSTRRRERENRVACHWSRPREEAAVAGHQ